MTIVRVRFQPGLRPKIEKHGSHDQSDHGNWAHGKDLGSNRLSMREIFELQKNTSDSQKQKVYDAENKYDPEIQHDIPKPFPPSSEKLQKGEITREEYDKGYKEYDKKFDEWTMETCKNIKSPLGDKHLDGTTKGVKNYYEAVTTSDWFVKEFGWGTQLGKPKVAVSRFARSAGSHAYGFKNGKPFHNFNINKQFAKNESTILHEISHFATTINETKSVQAHGKEYARNHLFVVNNVIGTNYAKGLENAYREAGVEIGD